jgi:hypothetical protein
MASARSSTTWMGSTGPKISWRMISMPAAAGQHRGLEVKARAQVCGLPARDQLRAVGDGLAHLGLHAVHALLVDQRAHFHVGCAIGSP